MRDGTADDAIAGGDHDVAVEVRLEGACGQCINRVTDDYRPDCEVVDDQRRDTDAIEVVIDFQTCEIGVGSGINERCIERVAHRLEP